MKKTINHLKEYREEILVISGVILLLTGFLAKSIIVAYLGLAVMVSSILISFK